MCTLKISHNALRDLPFSNLPLDSGSCSLSEIILSYNSLVSLPIELFNLPCLKKLDVSYNPLDSLPEKWWLSKTLKSLNLSHTLLNKLFQSNQKSFSQSAEIIRSSLPRGLARKLRSKGRILSESEDSITLLDQNLVSHASLDDFPKCLACYFPHLKCLDISNNNISSCCTIDEMPALLEELDISPNKLQSEGSVLFSLSPYRENHICYINSSYEDSVRCKHMCLKRTECAVSAHFHNSLN